MATLLRGEMPTKLTTAQRSLIVKRLKYFKWLDEGVLVIIFKDGTGKIVPRLGKREALIRKHHEGIGHFGVARTTSFVAASYWWSRMYTDVADYIRRCEICDRVKASFVPRTEVLHPLPIMGMFYRWYVA